MSKETGAEKDEFDLMLDDKEMNKSLSEKIGIKKETLKRKNTASSAATKGSGGGGKKKKTKSPWDNDSASGEPSSEVCMTK